MSRLPVLALLAIACGPSSSSPSAAQASQKAGSAAKSSTSVMAIHVDKRVELMSIVLRLANADEYHAAAKMPYTADVDAAFAAFAEHPAVAATRALREKASIVFDAPMQFAIHLDDNLELHDQVDLVAQDARWKGVDTVGYAAQLRDFARDAKLDAFMAAHASYYKSVESAFHDRIDVEKPIAWFEELFGDRVPTSFTVVPGLLEGGNNYGPHARVGDGVKMYQVIGLSTVDDRGVPKVDNQTIDLLIHEIAHSYINPVFDRHEAELLPAGNVLFPLVRDRMKAQAYGDARTMFNESGVRATTVLYVRDHRGDQAAAVATRAELRNGFVWTPELEATLRKFQHARAAFEDLDAFMPEIVAVFSKKATEYANGLPQFPFLGPVDAVSDGPHVVVVPTTSDAELANYVRGIHNRFHKTSPLVTASDHVYADNPNAGLVAYGSAQSNAVVARVLDQSGIKLTSEGILVGTKRFTGTDLVLIACWTRHDDSTHGQTIYAAAHDADLVGVNSIWHGGTDWLVARRTAAGFVTLGQGDYPHGADGTWLLP